MSPFCLLIFTVVYFRCKTCLIHCYAVYLLRRMRSVLAPNGSSINTPEIIVVGSGTPGTVMTLLSSVTAAFSAKALPDTIFAPVSKVMLASARIVPLNAVPVPRVAEEPTCQNTLSA